MPFKLILKIICQKYLINNYKLIYTDSLNNENIIIKIIKNNSEKKLYIELPDEINIDKKNGKRLKSCLQLWLPYICSLKRIKYSDLSINLNASDLGEKKTYYLWTL